jgi:hypothetical protein
MKKRREREYDPFANSAWAPRGVPADGFAHTAVNSAFVPAQGPPTVLNPGTADRNAVRNSVERSALETRYPGIAMTVSLLWGRPEMNDYFSKLWLADGNSEPIDPDAMAELMLLARLHQHLVAPRHSGALAGALGGDFDRFYGAAGTGPARRIRW